MRARCCMGDSSNGSERVGLRSPARNWLGVGRRAARLLTYAAPSSPDASGFPRSEQLGDLVPGFRRDAALVALDHLAVLVQQKARGQHGGGLAEAVLVARLARPQLHEALL